MTADTASLMPGWLPQQPVEFSVTGQPVTQGSKTAMPVMRAGRPVTGPGGRPVINMTDDNSKSLKPWRAEVVRAAQQAMRGHRPFDGPCVVSATFLFTRPAGHWRTGRNAHLLRGTAPAFPITKGRNDLDKLLRAVLDALTIAAVWADDSQCARFGRVEKLWAGPTSAARPGALIRIDVLL